MKQQLQNIELAAKQELEKIQDSAELESLRVKFLGKKGELTAILKQMSTLSAEERPVIGQLANKIRADIEEAITARSAELKAAVAARRLKEEKLDVTLPGKPFKVGKLHPYNAVLNEIEEIFLGMGFDIAEGPEVEYDYYNFEALNLPPDHPARDTQDTFYITATDQHGKTSTVEITVNVTGENDAPVLSVDKVLTVREGDPTNSDSGQATAYDADSVDQSGGALHYGLTVPTAPPCTMRSSMPTAALPMTSVRSPSIRTARIPSP